MNDSRDGARQPTHSGDADVDADRRKHFRCRVVIQRSRLPNHIRNEKHRAEDDDPYPEVEDHDGPDVGDLVTAGQAAPTRGRHAVAVRREGQHGNQRKGKDGHMFITMYKVCDMFGVEVDVVDVEERQQPHGDDVRQPAVDVQETHEFTQTGVFRVCVGQGRDLLDEQREMQTDEQTGGVGLQVSILTDVVGGHHAAQRTGDGQDHEDHGLS